MDRSSEEFHHTTLETTKMLLNSFLSLSYFWFHNFVQRYFILNNAYINKDEYFVSYTKEAKENTSNKTYFYVHFQDKWSKLKLFTKEFTTLLFDHVANVNIDIWFTYLLLRSEDTVWCLIWEYMISSQVVKYRFFCDEIVCIKSTRGEHFCRT